MDTKTHTVKVVRVDGKAIPVIKWVRKSWGMNLLQAKRFTFGEETLNVSTDELVEFLSEFPFVTLHITESDEGRWERERAETLDKLKKELVETFADLSLFLSLPDVVDIVDYTDEKGKVYIVRYKNGERYKLWRDANNGILPLIRIERLDNW